LWRYADPFRSLGDFLLRRDRDWIAIETKSTARADADQLRGRRAIQGLQGLRRRSITRAVIFGAPLVAGV
jgi:hypothetical protein